jgi:hypothetical protein
MSSPYFMRINEKLSKFTKKGQVLHAQSFACLLALYPYDLPNKGMCGEGDVVWFGYENFVNLLCSGREDSNYTLEVG